MLKTWPKAKPSQNISIVYANYDVQILLYESDPLHPSAEDITKATVSIVGYACKDNENLKTEMKHMSEIILKANDVNVEESDVIWTARQILNYTIGEKMIAKQEAIVQLGRLRLFHCSESIKTHAYLVFTSLQKNICTHHVKSIYCVHL